MINVSSVMNSLYTAVASNQTSIDSGFTVELSTVVNEDPNFMPWIGFFREPVEIKPRRLQKPNPWEYVYKPSVYVQVSNFSFNEQEPESWNRLDETLDVVFTAIDSQRTFVNCVYMITGYQIAPINYINDQDQPFFMYRMDIDVTKRIT